jgi:molecular chaperone DnaK (HSP70)
MEVQYSAIGKYSSSSYYLLGVDLGSSKSVLAAVRKGGIDIILSDSSGKQTP